MFTTLETRIRGRASTDVEQIVISPIMPSAAFPHSSNLCQNNYQGPAPGLRDTKAVAVESNVLGSKHDSAIYYVI